VEIDRFDPLADVLVVERCARMVRVVVVPEDRPFVVGLLVRFVVSVVRY
jgi:hypothetical protein